MREIELKFQVPAAARAAVRRAVATAGAHTVRLQARYFDTPDRRLAAQAFALRLRKEGPHWVQTLKGRGDGMMERFEHEVALAPSRAAPAIDLARHAGTPAGAALARALGDAPAGLVEVFATDIRRTLRQVRTAEGAVVELALDEGEIRAGRARRKVCELEFELLRGPAAGLIALASRWVARHALWLDVRSKAEQGERLAQGRTEAPPVHAEPCALQDAPDGAHAFGAMLANALRQALGNACELCEPEGAAATPEHLHQCRVGIRRLRSALRDFGALAGTPAPAEFQAWQNALALLFRRLGGARDLDALRELLRPVLAEAGAAPAWLAAADRPAEDPGAVLRAPAASRLWLALLGWLQTLPAAAGTPADAQAAWQAEARARLRRLHRRIAADAARFTDLGETARHRVRKRVKRLRYGLEFCFALYAPAALERYLPALRAAQAALGDYHDLVVARVLLEARAGTDPVAAAALSWLMPRRARALERCRKTLAKLADAPGFWRRRARFGRAARASPAGPSGAATPPASA